MEEVDNAVKYCVVSSNKMVLVVVVDDFAFSSTVEVDLLITVEVKIEVRVEFRIFIAEVEVVSKKDSDVVVLDLISWLVVVKTVVKIGRYSDWLDGCLSNK
jgi:hypothetical protein